MIPPRFWARTSGFRHDSRPDRRLARFGQSGWHDDHGTTYPHAPGFVAGDRPEIVTSRFRHEDSHTLERSLATGGYDGLKAALRAAPAAVHEEVRSATVLGRGGAGFPAGVKWGLTPQGVWPRYLVVNGDESEPGTYKDRLLMELDPHQLIEGCLIACYAVGLSQCFLYIRGEMAVAQERVATALNEAYAAGSSARNILGTDFSVDIVMAWGAGAYVVGEETALIESLEGNRGMPRLKPPFFPAAIGLYGQPTIVNNVETLSNLPWLLLNGADSYTAIGTETSPGTRMVAVSGHVGGRACSRSSTARRRSATCSTARSSARASVTTTGSRRSCPVAGRPRGSCPISSTCRSRASSSAPPGRCSARERSW